MSGTSRVRAHGAVAVAAGAMLAAMGALHACVSERATGTPETAGGCDIPLPAEAFGSTIVVIRGFAFTPAQVRVRPGAKVTWVNCEAAASDAHTSTSDAGAWSSPLLAPKSTFTRVFTVVGTFPYHCAPHPGMRATVTVE